MNQIDPVSSPRRISNACDWFLKNKTDIDIVVNESFKPGLAIAVDVETDEKDNFVCASAYSGAGPVHFWNSLDKAKSSLEGSKLIGHNLKGDLHWLKRWGLDLSEDNLYADTMIMSYCQNSVRESHGLKPVALECLGLKWPSYKEIVGTGRGKTTLDKQPEDVVMNYNCFDTFATWSLYRWFLTHWSPNQKHVFDTIEMPINRLLFQMEEKGVMLDAAYLNVLDKEYLNRLIEIMETVRAISEPEIKILVEKYNAKEKWEISALKKFKESNTFNPGSWQQKRLLLGFLGMEMKSTNKANLVKYKGNKLIDLLLEHSKFAKLYNTFIKQFQSLTTLPLVHTTYSQVSEDVDDEDDQHGINTARLSSKQPNLQQIPARTEDGKKLRNLFIGRGGKQLIVADYSQIELRLPAHFSGDPLLVKAFQNGEDVHEASANAYGVDRYWGKLCNFLFTFRGSPYRFLDVVNAELRTQGKPPIDIDKAKEFYTTFWRNHRVLWDWEEDLIKQARLKGGVRTIIERWHRVLYLTEQSAYNRAVEMISIVNRQRAARGDRLLTVGQLTSSIVSHAEKQAISKVVQGSAAEIIKLSMLECAKKGYFPILTVHDELVFESDTPEKHIRAIKEIMENVVKLNVPLEVEIGGGRTWGEAKK